MRLFVLAVLAFSAVPAQAQMWDAPTFFSPRPGEDLGIYVIDGEGAGDLGFAGIWRQAGNLNLGVRAGFMGSDHISVGAEFYGPLAIGGASRLQLAWNLGLGATFNDATALRIPLGVSVGAVLGSGSMSIMPYVHPRVAFDLVAYEIAGQEETETEFNVPVDVGADIIVSPSFVVRVGATFNDSRNAFGAGLAWRMGRRLVVR